MMSNCLFHYNEIGGDNMNIFKLSLKQQINGLVFNVLFVMAILLSGLSIWSTITIAEDLTSHTMNMKLSGDIHAMQEYISSRYGVLKLADEHLIDSNGQPLAGKYDIVDKISEDLGVVTTIFERTDNDFTRISTSIRQVNGQRAVGTKLGTTSAAYEPVMEKKLFLGEAMILGESYVTAYQPIIDNTQNVIGILFLGIPQREVQTIMNKSLKTMLQTSLAACLIILISCLIISFIFGNRLVHNFSKIIQDMTNTSDHVAIASTKVSSTSQQLAQGAGEQASSLEETSSSLEEMASMTRQNADNAVKTDKLMKDAQNVIITGVAAVSKMAYTIDMIKNSTEKTADIIKTIDDIAFKTNILALNAAVEAAHAGEAGAEFSVVADEVRNLAHQSSEAAKHTTSLIKTVQDNTDAGVLVTIEVSNSLKAIEQCAGQVATLVAEITEASKEQSNGIEQINTAMGEMDKVVQQNSSNAEQSAVASEELSSLAHSLKAKISELMAIVGRAGEKPGS